MKSVAQGCQEAYVGRKRTLPDVAVALVITTLTCILATKAIIWTIPLLRPIALGAIASAGCAHFLTDGGKDRFCCSRWWLNILANIQEWSFRKPKKNRRKLPGNWKELIQDMQLRAVYFVMKYTVPPALFVNADHIGILYLQVKGS